MFGFVFSLLLIFATCSPVLGLCEDPALTYTSKYDECWPKGGDKFPVHSATCRCFSCNHGVNLTCFFNRDTRNFYWKIDHPYNICDECYCPALPLKNKARCSSLTFAKQDERRDCRCTTNCLSVAYKCQANRQWEHIGEQSCDTKYYTKSIAGNMRMIYNHGLISFRCDPGYLSVKYGSVRCFEGYLRGNYPVCRRVMATPRYTPSTPKPIPTLPITSTTELPETTTEVSTTTETPTTTQITTTEPPETTEASETTTENPETTTENPETTTKNPETTTKNPETTQTSETTEVSEITTTKASETTTEIIKITEPIEIIKITEPIEIIKTQIHYENLERKLSDLNVQISTLPYITIGVSVVILVLILIVVLAVLCARRKSRKPREEIQTRIIDDDLYLPENIAANKRVTFQS